MPNDWIGWFDKFLFHFSLQFDFWSHSLWLWLHTWFFAPPSPIPPIDSQSKISIFCFPSNLLPVVMPEVQHLKNRTMLAQDRHIIPGVVQLIPAQIQFFQVTHTLQQHFGTIVKFSHSCIFLQLFCFCYWSQEITCRRCGRLKLHGQHKAKQSQIRMKSWSTISSRLLFFL